MLIKCPIVKILTLLRMSVITSRFAIAIICFKFFFFCRPFLCTHSWRKSSLFINWRETKAKLMLWRFNVLMLKCLEHRLKKIARKFLSGMVIWFATTDSEMSGWARQCCNGMTNADIHNCHLLSLQIMPILYVLRLHLVKRLNNTQTEFVFFYITFFFGKLTDTRNAINVKTRSSRYKLSFIPLIRIFFARPYVMRATIGLNSTNSIRDHTQLTNYSTNIKMKLKLFTLCLMYIT